MFHFQSKLLFVSTQWDECVSEDEARPHLILSGDEFIFQLFNTTSKLLYLDLIMFRTSVAVLQFRTGLLVLLF